MESEKRIEQWMLDAGKEICCGRHAEKIARKIAAHVPTPAPTANSVAEISQCGGNMQKASSPLPAEVSEERIKRSTESRQNASDPNICPVHGKPWHHTGTAADGREMYVCKFGCGEFRGIPARMNRPNDFGFEVCRTEDDILIRDTDSSEWTSGIVWARSSPGTVVTMLADLWDALQEAPYPLPAPTPSLKWILAASPELRDLIKEIVGVGKPEYVDCDEIGMKDAGWKAKMPKLSQWLSICAKAKRMLEEFKAKAPSPLPAPKVGDCDCPCDICGVDTGKHCGRPPCDQPPSPPPAERGLPMSNESYCPACGANITGGIRNSPLPAEDGWISVEERLPGKQVMVLVSNRDWPAGFPVVMMGHLDGLGKWCGHYADQTMCGWNISDKGLPTHDPTHWRPLPSPPSSRKEEKYPRPCDLCGGVIQSKDDLDFHGNGNCKDWLA